MAYYSSPALCYSIYLPIALAAAALPYALSHQRHSKARLEAGPGPLHTALLGFALVISAVAGLSVALGMGSGYLFAAWGMCAIAAAGFVSVVSFTSSVSIATAVFSCHHLSIIYSRYVFAAWGVRSIVAAGFVTMVSDSNSAAVVRTHGQ